MAQNVRQSELFAGQDWTVIYKAFTEVNFNAYDWDTIRESMKEYIQRNYPEDFNDWIASSEFVAILDLLAYLGQSLAFRMDINSRENIMETARSRESILRLARFLSYSPKRNHAAKGLVKLTEIRTNQDLYDSTGTNLNSLVIRWDDPNNPNWFEQFIMVLNASLINTNPYGTPLKISNIDGIATQLYRLNNIPQTGGNVPFNSTVNGATMGFDVVNVDFDTRMGFTERDPNPESSFHIVYRNDGNGNSSAHTGFFLMFKQGIMGTRDFLITDPIENRIIDLDIPNINEDDVWVQTVNDDGTVVTDWTRVGYVPADDISKVVINNENVTYNSLSTKNQNIFQVITRDNDQISLRFGDSRFGAIPMGNLRIWFRQSAGEYMSIRPEDMRNVLVSQPYVARDQKQRNVFMTFSLQETTINSTPAETNADIRRRAGAVYATQGRMVSGGDYNSLPATNNLALKIKSINRIYSGQSRYIDLNDPTGTYQNTNVFSDDGAIYRENHNFYTEIPLMANQTGLEIVMNVITPALSNVEMRDFFYETWLKLTGTSILYNFEYDNEALYWQQSTNAIYSSTGRFAKSMDIPASDAEWNTKKAPMGVNAPADTPESFLVPGSLIKFRDAGWVTLAHTVNPGSDFKANGEGQIRLNEAVETGDRVLRILPAYRRVMNPDELFALSQHFDNRRTFGVGFDHVKQEWYFIESSHLRADGAYNYGSRGSQADNSWIIRCEYSSLNWRITTRGLRYVFESNEDVKFFFVNDYRSIDRQTGRVGYDTVNLLNANLNPKVLQANVWTPETHYVPGDVIAIRRTDVTEDKPSFEYNYYECLVDHSSGLTFTASRAHLDNSNPAAPKAVLVELWRSVQPGMTRDTVWNLENTYIYDDGFMEPRRVRVSFNDADLDGQPDDPESFRQLVPSHGWVFHERLKDINGYDYYKIRADLKAVALNAPMPVLNPNEIIWVYDAGNEEGQFYQNHLGARGIPTIGRLREISPIVDQTEYRAARGRKDMKFQWKHFAPVDHRIDPAISNIIDVFVLTREYNEKIQQWVRAGANPAIMPKPPTEMQLRMSYVDLEEFKMFSDQMVWRPVKYKVLFGNGAPTELRCKFKIVKQASTTVSDGEIKSRVVQAVQEFFNVNNWDFGETFYYTELSSHIHMRMADSISSVVIVPLKENQAFGNLFEVRSQPDEIFFPTSSVADVEIIPANTQTSLRIR